MKRSILWLGTALLTLPALAQNPCDSLTADFSWGNNGGDPNVIFYSANSNFATTWIWAFGDGSFGSGPQGVHTYPGPGTYELCLKVYGWIPGSQDTCSATSCQMITIGGGSPCDSAQLAFTTAPQGNNGVLFAGSVAPPASSYQWIFGDGTSEFGGLVADHQYGQPGEYYACLVAYYWDDNAQDSCGVETCQWITVSDTTPCDGINADFNVGTQGNTAYFDNTLSSNDYTYYWNFGDGSTGYGPGPTHTYANAGNYYACLIMWAWDDETQDTCFADHCEWVNVAGQGDPCDSLYACFQWGTQNNVVTFYNCSWGGGQDVNYTWNFGDGTLSDAENPEHTFPGPGTYNVCLTVSLANSPDSCNNTICNEVVVGGGSPCDSAQLSFNAYSQGNGWMIFYGSATPPAGGYQWIFGDGTTEFGGLGTDHQYAEPGEYYACLAAWYWNEDTQDTCWTEACQWINVSGGDPCDSLNACFQSGGQNNVVSFYNCSYSGGMNVDYLWDFGDGTFSDDMNPAHTFPLPGEYYVCLTIYGNNGQDSCQNTTCQWVNVNGGGSPCDQLNADFSASSIGSTAFFDNALSSNDFVYTWNFGDGTTGYGPDPSHTYDNEGTYYVCLLMWAWDEQAQDTCFADHCEWVTVNGQGDPCDSLYACFQWGTQNNVVTFYNCSWGGGQDLIYYWSFGDGTYSDVENPMHTYPGTGTYNTCLTVWFANAPDSCTTTICNNVVIGGGGSPCDDAQLSFTSFNQGGGVVVFTGSAVPAAGAYQWFFGDGSNAGGGLTTQHFYAEPGVYNVCLVGWYWDELNEDSCAVESCQWVYVSDGEPCDSITACFQWDEQNNTYFFDNCSWAGGQDLGYAWDFGDGTTSDAMDPSHIFPGPGIYIVCLTASLANSPDSCSNTICNTVVITGGGSPCDDLNADFTPNAAGLTVNFASFPNPPGTMFVWSFGDGATGYGPSPTHTYPEQGGYQVCLVVGVWDEQAQDTCFADHCEFITLTAGGDPCDSLLNASFEYQTGDALGALFWNTSQTGLNDVLVWWDFGDNTPWTYGQEVTHSFPELGYYYVCMYISGWIPGTQDSCMAMVCDTVLLGITGIEDPIAGSQLITWPQPFDNVLTVEHQDMQGDVRYTLTDVAGRIVATDHMQVSTRMTLDLGWLPAGHYVLQVRSERMDAVVRVMKR